MRGGVFSRLYAAASGMCLMASTPSAHAQDAAELLAAAGTGVVLVLAADDAGAGRSGAGFVVSPEGKIVTLAQTVQDPKTHQAFGRVYVYLRPKNLAEAAAANLQQRFVARIIAVSAPDALNLALLQLEEAPTAMQPLTFGNAEKIVAGSEALLVGHAEGGGLWSGQRLRLVNRVDNYARQPGRQCWVLDRGVDSGQWGGPLLDTQGHVQGMVMSPVPPSAQARRNNPQATDAPAPATALTSTVLIGWLAQNNMALALPNAPPGGDPDSISDNPTPQPSTVALVDAAPDADAARRRATAAACGPKEPALVPDKKRPARAIDFLPAARKDSFVALRRPYSLRQVHRQQLPPLAGGSQPAGLVSQPAAAKAVDKKDEKP